MENTIYKLEMFSSEDDDKHLINSAKEIKFILKGIAEKGTHVALYYGKANDFFMTTLLDVDGSRLWLEQSKDEAINIRVLASEKVIFVGAQHAVKIQFAAQTPTPDIHNGNPAYLLPIPQSIYRLQRREYFRLTTPARPDLKCIISTAHVQHKQRHEVTIMDISGKGVALVCAENDIELVPGESYPGCTINIPDFGTITGTIMVKNMAVLTDENGRSFNRAGCEIQDMDNASILLIQRYVMHLQLSK